MKRTTERADLVQKDTPEYISGCRQFEGEDLSYAARRTTNAQLQKEWIQEQKREHDWENQNNCLEDQQYANQTKAITQMRQILEDESTMKKKQMMKEMQQYNQMLAQEKRDRESQWFSDQQAQNSSEIERTNMSDIMQENFQTTKSELAPHRFVPYHFKGLRKEQIEDIVAQRDQQIVDAKLAQKNQSSEEFQWAVQNLSNTQHQLNNELDLQNRQKQAISEQRDANLAERDAKNARWPNMYGDLNKLPNVERDMVAGSTVRPIL